MKKKNVKKLLAKSGAILEGHFVGTSEKHLDTYINKDQITSNPQNLDKLAKALAKKAKQLDVDVVVAPAMGAIVLGSYVAFYMEVNTSVFCEKDESAKNGFVFKRGYDKLLKGKKVLVVEDILNTGKSSKQTIETVREYGGKVVGLASLVNRGGVTKKDLGVKRLITLLKLDLKAYDANNCPLCNSEIPVNTEVGHGTKFLKKK